MKLFHGSNVEIESIDLARGRRGKDFGKGFYANPDYMQAVEFCSSVIRREGVGVPTVTSFDFDESALNVLNVMRFDGYSKEWAEFILLNRNNTSDVPAHDYDIVVGPIADDGVGTQIRRLSRGFITFDAFLEELKYSKVSIQYFFGTEEAIKYLKKI